MRSTNAVGTNTIEIPLGLEMDTFDRLPTELKDALRYAGGKYSAVQFRQILEDHGLGKAVAHVRRSDEAQGFGDAPGTLKR